MLSVMEKSSTTCSAGTTNEIKIRVTGNDSAILDGFKSEQTVVTSVSCAATT